MRRVRRHPDFRADFHAHLGWIEDQGEEAWALGLVAEVVRISAFLAEFPSMGLRLQARGSVELRQLRLVRLPFIAWYLLDTGAGDAEVWLVRLFHARQLRPEPDVGLWPTR